MTIKTHTQKDGTIWEWEETPELKQWISLEVAKKGMLQYNNPIKEQTNK
jgi:hypothetical protein